MAPSQCLALSCLAPYSILFICCAVIQLACLPACHPADLLALYRYMCSSYRTVPAVPIHRLTDRPNESVSHSLHQTLNPSVHLPTHHSINHPFIQPTADQTLIPSVPSSHEEHITGNPIRDRGREGGTERDGHQSHVSLCTIVYWLTMSRQKKTCRGPEGICI